MSYYDPYGMVQPGFVPGGPGDPSMGGAGYYGGMPGLLGPQGPAVNLGLLYRPWEPSYQETYGPSGMYGFSWPTLPNWSSDGDRGWLPNWDDVNPPEPEPKPEDPTDPNDTRNPENRGGKMAGADSMLSPPVDLLDYYSDSVAGIGMDLDFNTAINAHTMGLNPTSLNSQVTRDVWGRTLPGYTTPGVTTSAVTTALPSEPEVKAEEISVTDLTNDFSGGNTSGNDMGGWGGGPSGETSGGSSGVGPGGVGGGVGKGY